MLLRLRAEAQFVDVVDDLAQVVAAGDLVLDLAEDLADLVFDGVRPAGLLLEAVQVGEQLLVDEVAQVVAGQRLVVVELAVLALGRGPAFPAIRLLEDVGVFLPVQRGLVGPVLLQPVEVFQEQQPRGLLGVVQFGRAAGLFPEDVVDILEGLFKHLSPNHLNCSRSSHSMTGWRDLGNEREFLVRIGDGPRTETYPSLGTSPGCRSKR